MHRGFGGGGGRGQDGEKGTASWRVCVCAPVPAPAPAPASVRRCTSSRLCAVCVCISVSLWAGVRVSLARTVLGPDLARRQRLTWGLLPFPTLPYPTLPYPTLRCHTAELYTSTTMPTPNTLPPPQHPPGRRRWSHIFTVPPWPCRRAEDLQRRRNGRRHQGAVHQRGAKRRGKRGSHGAARTTGAAVHQRSKPGLKAKVSGAERVNVFPRVGFGQPLASFSGKTGTIDGCDLARGLGTESAGATWARADR